jgi:lipocalin
MVRADDKKVYLWSLLSRTPTSKQNSIHLMAAVAVKEDKEL